MVSSVDPMGGDPMVSSGDPMGGDPMMSSVDLLCFFYSLLKPAIVFHQVSEGKEFLAPVTLISPATVLTHS